LIRKENAVPETKLHFEVNISKDTSIAEKFNSDDE